VNTAVALAKANRCAWAAGFVNGLLRRAAAGTGQIPWPDPTQSPADALALEHALPRWLTARWIDRWGVETTGRLGVFLNTIPDITLRTNTLKTDRRRLMAAIEKEARRLSITQRSPEGVRLAQLARPITQMPAYRKGWFQVQDEAAQLVSHLLAPRPDETVWDACAGLGTKSGHLAQLMKNRGTIVATDISSTKRDCLGREMQRLGVAIVHGHAADLTTPASLPQLPMFDRILMDAPCSGLGVLQKNPDGKWRHAPEDLFAYHQRQVIMLDTASRRLRPGGRLVYAVCSMEPEENESVVKAFLQSHPEFAIDSCGTNLADIATALGDALNSEGCLRSFPHQHGMDGFFAASLMKQA
ncbi:MAG: hypothetical protein KJP07_22630, partial [Desulfatitalea sp.]|nr:hypothetical protein [Desulfatitalea sp.]